MDFTNLRESAGYAVRFTVCIIQIVKFVSAFRVIYILAHERKNAREITEFANNPHHRKDSRQLLAE